ncbi:MAG: hypothetical protein KatS3mg113_1040 [Planctomycetaceae bacterium]|nr:MAG: hypothetical protein KatS3mg113_1040 [Planctomycetaceae bacterium]
MEHDALPDDRLTLAVQRAQTVMAHAWMVRTFVKHSPEAEEHPELMEVVRLIFDTARQLEIYVNDPRKYIEKLRGKLPKWRRQAEAFAQQAPLISDHTNFHQAVLSFWGCVTELEAIAGSIPPPQPAKLPSHFRPPMIERQQHLPSAIPPSTTSSTD